MRAVHQSNIFDGHEKDRQLRHGIQGKKAQILRAVFIQLAEFCKCVHRNPFKNYCTPLFFLSWFVVLCFFVFILALQSKLYTWVGKMIAVCVIHGGVGLHFFSERLFRQICGMEMTPATVDEVGDHTFREQWFYTLNVQSTVTQPSSCFLLTFYLWNASFHSLQLLTPN